MSATLVAGEIAGAFQGYAPNASPPAGSLTPTSWWYEDLLYSPQALITGFTANQIYAAWYDYGTGTAGFAGRPLIVNGVNCPIVGEPVNNGSGSIDCFYDYTPLFVVGNSYTISLGSAGSGTPDTTPPNITSSNTVDVLEENILSHSLTANETVTWSLEGGDDVVHFEINGSTLRWVSDGTKDFETPQDANANNTYEVIVRATDAAGNYSTQSITVTVTDVIEYIGPTHKAAGALAAGTANITPVIPTYAAGDRLIMFVETANQVVTAPTGWTLVSPSPQGTGTAASTTATRITVFTKVAVSGETNPTVIDPGDHAAAYILSFTPCDISVTSGNAQTTTSATATFPALTTTTPHNLVLAAVATATDIGTARASNWTNDFIEIADASTTQGNGGGLAVAMKQLTSAGVVGTTQATLATSTLQGRMMISLMNSVPQTGGKAKVWNGSSWNAHPVKVWNGSSWVSANVKHYNGTMWNLSKSS